MSIYLLEVGHVSTYIPTKKRKRKKVGPTGRMRYENQEKRKGKGKGGREVRCVFGLTGTDLNAEENHVNADVGECTVGQDPPVTFFFFNPPFSLFSLSFFFLGMGKRSSYVETYSKVRKGTL